jgi:hypothetical protein
MVDDLIPAQQPAFLSQWNFVTATGAPPLTAETRLNQTSQKAANRLRIHKITANGIDASILLDVVKIGDVINLHDLNDATKWHDFVVTAAPIKQTDYWDYPVSWQAGGGVNLSAGKIMIDLPFIDIAYQVRPMPALSIVSGHVTISGQLVTFDYAYPFQGKIYTSPGLTKRQYYAAMAMQGFVASNAVVANLIGKISDYSFKLADSMIAAEKQQEEGVTPPIAGQAKTPPTTVQQLKTAQAAAVTTQARKAS